MKPPTGDQAPRKKHGNPSASLPDKQSIKINNKVQKAKQKKPFYIHTQLVDRGTNNILLMPRLVKIKHQHHPLGLRKLFKKLAKSNTTGYWKKITRRL